MVNICEVPSGVRNTEIQRWTRVFPEGTLRLKARRGNLIVIIFILGHNMTCKGQFKKQEHRITDYLRLIPLTSLMNFYIFFSSTFFEDPQVPNCLGASLPIRVKPAPLRYVIKPLWTHQRLSNSYVQIWRTSFKVCTCYEVSSL